MPAKKRSPKFRGSIYSNINKFRKEIKKNTATAILAAFAFIIALVWRDAIQAVVDKVLLYINLTGDAYLYKIVAAIVVTLICVVGILYFSKWSEQ